MADEYTIHESTADMRSDPVYTSKQWAYQVDQNNGSYASRQVIFDLSGFYNSQRFINPQEMFLVVPIVTTLTSSNTLATASAGTTDGLGANPFYAADANGVPTAYVGAGNNAAQITDQFAMGFKSGYWNLINSIQIQVDGKDVIQTIPNINYHASFVANTSWSKSDVEKHGPLLGFLPDKADSWKIVAGRSEYWGSGILGNANGWGVCNNSLVNAPSIYPNNGNVASFIGSATNANINAGQSNMYFPNSQVAPELGQAVNDSFLQRMKWTNRLDKVSSITGVTKDDSTFGQTYSRYAASAASIQNSIENYMVCETQTLKTTLTGNDTTPAVADYVNEDANSTKAFRQLITTCIIRFKDICNLFANLPISRGLYMRMIINMNLGSLIIPCSGTLAAGPAPAIAGFPLYCPDNTSGGTGALLSGKAKYINNFINPTCPIMLAPMQASALTNGKNAAGNANVPGLYPNSANLMIYPGMAADTGTVNRGALVLSVNIAAPDSIHVQQGLSASAALQKHKLSSCFVYAPIIDMEPALTSKYLTENKIKGVKYRDVYSYVIPATTKGNNFTIQLANGVVNAKRLILIPFLVPSGSSGTDANMLFEPLSPFDSAPATTAPLAELGQFQVLISNMNIFQRAIDYSFENFIEEMSLCNAINGGLGVGLTSGLIDFDKWINLYRYYVVDLSRRLAGMIFIYSEFYNLIYR